MSASNKKTGMAITALVFGILSLTCFFILAGIPAIILGHIAHSNSRKLPEQYGGGGMAIAGCVMGYVSVIITIFMLALVLPAMLLPALSQAKNRALDTHCQNNMKQIGLAMRNWDPNGDQFPFNLSTNKKGTLELCLPDSEGFDSNAYRHFQVLSNELGTPKILWCPADSEHFAATEFRDLQPNNVSYQLRSGTNVTSDSHDEILARCPIHHTILRADGSVERVGSRRF